MIHTDVRQVLDTDINSGLLVTQQPAFGWNLQRLPLLQYCSFERLKKNVDLTRTCCLDLSVRGTTFVELLLSICPEKYRTRKGCSKSTTTTVVILTLLL